MSTFFFLKFFIVSEIYFLNHNIALRMYICIYIYRHYIICPHVRLIYRDELSEISMGSPLVTIGFIHLCSLVVDLPTIIHCVVL